MVRVGVQRGMSRLTYLPGRDFPRMAESTTGEGAFFRRQLGAT
jgi:hypothetical protein